VNRDGGRVLDAGPVFGVTDTQNGDDLAGDVAASRRFDVAGATDLAEATDLALSIDVEAMRDFETDRVIGVSPITGVAAAPSRMMKRGPG